VLCFWTIKGNGDHTLALLKKGPAEFQVNRIAAYLMGSHIVAAPGGGWYLIEDRIGFFVIHQIDRALKISEIGKIRRHRTSGVLDANFISKDIIHIFARSQENAHVTLRCMDFDIRERKLLHNRELLNSDRIALFGAGQALRLRNDTLHWLWS